MSQPIEMTLDFQIENIPKNGDIGAIKLCMGLFIIQHRLPSAQKELRSPLRYGKFWWDAKRDNSYAQEMV